MSENMTDHKMISLLEAKFEALEKSHKRLAEAHFGDNEECQVFLDRYKADLDDKRLEVSKLQISV
jgi:hypothetical protein